jgi:molybdopterin/thiamine biosynthesis adenylyltransferase
MDKRPDLNQKESMKKTHKSIESEKCEDGKDLNIVGACGSIDDDLYDRQKRIQGWDQDAIERAHILIIGCGATGNELIKNLALVGVGNLTLVDYDFINKSNLNRCILFSEANATKNEYKAEVVAKNVKKIRDCIKVEVLLKNLNDLPVEIYEKTDIICSCLDNVEARIQANNYAYYYKKPFVDSGIDGFMGTIQSAYAKVPEKACFQCGISDRDLDVMWKKFSCTGEPIPGEEGETQRKIGTIITTTSIIGGLQAQQVLKFILGSKSFSETKQWNPYIGAPLIGQQLLYNGVLNTFTIIEKHKNPDCWICGSKTMKQR